MATYRIGIGSFNLKDGAVGLGTESSGLGNLKVKGTVKTTDLDVLGVSTFTRYAGFAADDLNINRDTSLTGEHSTQGDIVVGLNSTFTVSTGATVTVGTVESVSIGTHFSPPTGGVEDRPEAPVEGTVRFNTDLNTLEFYNGVEWRQFNVSGQSGRGVFGGKNGGGGTQFLVDSIQISTKGNSVDWGTMLRGRYVGQNCVGGETRVIFAGGYGLSPSPETGDLNAMDYGTFASGGQCEDFGNLVDSRRGGGRCGSSTRGIYWGGESAPNQLIDYFEIATTGNALEFQDLGGSNTGGQMCCSSPTRGIAESSNVSEGLRYIIIASKGSTKEFGNYMNSSYMGGFVSNGTRGVIAGGYNPLTPAGYNQKEIGYINLASTGNASYFGDLTVGRGTSGVSDSIRGVFGTHNPSNIIDYINFASQGNAEDFGDLSYTHTSSQICGSDSHGGLGGF